MPLESDATHRLLALSNDMDTGRKTCDVKVNVLTPVLPNVGAPKVPLRRNLTMVACAVWL